MLKNNKFISIIKTFIRSVLNIYNLFIEIITKIKIQLMFLYYHPIDFLFVWKTILICHYYKIRLKFKIFLSDSYYKFKKWYRCERYRWKFYLYSRWYILASVFLILYLFVSFTDLAFDPASEADLYKFVLYKGETAEWKIMVFAHIFSFLIIAVPLTILFLLSQQAEDCLVIDLWAFYLGTCVVSQYRFPHYWEIIFGYVGSQIWVTLIILHLATYFTAHLSDWEVDFEEDEDEEEEEEEMLLEERDGDGNYVLEPFGDMETNVFMGALIKGKENGAFTKWDQLTYAVGVDYEDEEEEMFLEVARQDHVVSSNEDIKIPEEELKHIKYDIGTYYVRKVYPFLFDMSADGLDEDDYSEEDYEIMGLHFIEWNLTHNTFIDYIDSFHKDYNLNVDENSTADEKFENEFKYTEDLDRAFSIGKPLPREAQLKKLWMTLNYSMDELDERFHKRLKKYINNENVIFLFVYDFSVFTKSVSIKTKNELKRYNVKYIQNDWSNFNEATDLQKNLIYDLRKLQKQQQKSLRHNILKRYYRFNATYPKIAKFLLIPLWSHIYENFKKHSKNIEASKIPLIKLDTTKREYSFSSRLSNYKKQKIKKYFIRFNIFRLKFKLFIKRIFIRKIKKLYYVLIKLLVRFFLFLKRKIVFFFYKKILFFHSIWKLWSFAPDDWYDVRIDISTNIRLILFDINTFKSVSYDLINFLIALIVLFINSMLDLEPNEIWIAGPYSVHNPYYNKNLYRRKMKLIASNTDISYTLIKDKINEERRWKKLEIKFKGKIHTINNKKFFLKLISKKF
jgi:hypothetical protein